MKLYLFGGAEIDLPSRSVLILKNLIKETLIKIDPKSILHIPFARLKTVESDKGEWDEGWFKALMIDTNIKIIDARNNLDLDKENVEVIFINGGPERKGLIEEINKNTQLLKAILNSKYIIGESSGSMIMGEYFRTSRANNEMIRGIGILRNTVIEPHYTERDYKMYIDNDMESSGMKYGVGIDSATGIIINPAEFPNKWEKIGVGNIFIVQND